MCGIIVLRDLFGECGVPQFLLADDNEFDRVKIKKASIYAGLFSVVQLNLFPFLVQKLVFCYGE
jgi:hypothetical protein